MVDIVGLAARLPRVGQVVGTACQAPRRTATTTTLTQHAPSISLVTARSEILVDPP